MSVNSIQSTTAFCKFLWIPFLLCGMAMTGCQPTVQSDPETPAKTGEDSVAATETTSVIPGIAHDSKSPATGIEPEAMFDLTASGVCQRFMELLQSGNRIGAENLLTRASLLNTTKAGLKLEPMGGPKSTFQLGEVRYANNLKRLAQVDCRISESVDGTKVDMDVTWQVRKIKNAWRISGVVLELDSGQAPDLLSFENMDDIAKIKSFAGEDAIAADSSRQARNQLPADDQTEIK